jgi:hypothetical protein
VTLPALGRAFVPRRSAAHSQIRGGSPERSPNADPKTGDQAHVRMDSIMDVFGANTYSDRIA